MAISGKARELQEWLAEFPADEVRKEVTDLEEEVGNLEGEIRYRRRLLEIRNQALGINESDDPPAAIQTVAESVRRQIAETNAVVRKAAIQATVGPRPDSEVDSASPDAGFVVDQPFELSRADKLLLFFDRHRGETWKLSDICRQLIVEGQLEDSEADVHGLQVAASRLARNGKLERPGPGLYRLPVATPYGGG